ncbi:MAG: hypothetical protein ABIO39_03340 [Caulobacteraceae bacterium]
MTDLSSRLIGDVRGAGKGLWRLAKFDPAWTAGFDASAAGFVRSFAGPLLALPPYLLMMAMLTRDPTEGLADGGDKLIWASALAHIANAVAYPAVMAVVARAFGVGEGYGGFIVVTNWAQLFLVTPLAAASVLTLAGDAGAAVFRFMLLLQLVASIYVIWRAARQTLSTEIAPALLSVVLAVAISEGVSQAALFAFR